MSRYMNLTVVQVQGPVRILARETPGPTASVETIEYASFFKEMNNYFNNDILTFEIHSPKPNEICAALSSRNNRWHRVRVREIMTTLSGAKADCFFLDTGETQMVQIVKMKKIPERFLTVPFQVKVFALYGLQPLSLVLDPTMTACKKPCKKWDKSAAIHIKKLINCASAIQAVIKSRGEENVLLAVIYLRFSGSNEILSLNDEMVNKGYAIKDMQINKSSDEETNNILQDVFQTKYSNQRRSQKPGQLEYPIYNSSVSLNGFHQKPLVNNHRVRVEETSISDIPQIDSSDDFDSSSSSDCPRNNFVTKYSPKIHSSANIPFKTLTKQQTAFSAMEQLLSYHKRLQQNNKMEKESDSSLSAQPSRNVSYSSSSGRQRSAVEPQVPKWKSHESISPSKSMYKPRVSPIKPVSHHKDNSSSPNIRQKSKSHSVNYHLPNVEKNPYQTDYNGCNLKSTTVPILESDSSYMTEDSEIFYNSDEIMPKNSLSAVISTNLTKKVISTDSLVKNQQTFPENVSNVKTESALSSFLAFHKKLVSSKQDSMRNMVGPKNNDYFSKLSAKRCADNRNNQSKNSSPVSYCKRTMGTETHQNNSVHNDKCNSKITLSSYEPSQTIFNPTSLAKQPLSVTDHNSNNSVHCYQTESDVPFSGIQSEDDDDDRPRSAMDFHWERVKRSQKINVPLLDNSDCAKTRGDSGRKPSFSSKDFSSPSNSDSSDETFNKEDEDIVNCNIVTDEKKDIISNPTSCSSRKNICSESENSESCQSNTSSKETVLTTSGLSTSAVNILNHSVSSKLLSSSPGNTIRMLQGLNSLPMNKLNEYENSSYSRSVFLKEYQPFTGIDDSDLSETGDDKPYLSGTFGFYPGKSSCENAKKKLGNDERKVVTSDDSKTSPIIPSQVLSDTKCLSSATSPVSPLNDEETFSSGFKFLERSLQPQISTREQNLIFEDEVERPIINSKQEYLSLSKIEDPPEIPAVIPDFERDHSTTDDMKTNEKDTDTFMTENLEEENDDPSFEVSAADENQDSTNADLSHKDCIAAPDSANSHEPATDTAISQENKTEDILPPFMSENLEEDPSIEITARNNESPVLSIKSSDESLDEKVLSSDESEKNDHLECLKSVEQAEGGKDCSSSSYSSFIVDVTSGSDLETRPVSLALSSIADSTELTDSKPVDIKDPPIICKDNAESTSILEMALNENIESPSITMPSKINSYAEMPRLEDDMASVSLSTLPGVSKSMPALTDQSTDSESGSPAKDPTSVSMLDLTDAKAISDIFQLLSPFKNLKDSISTSLPDLTVATIETKFTSPSVNMNEDVLSDSQSSIAGPDDITESEPSSVKTSSEIQLVSSSTETTANDDSNISSSLLSTDDKNKELESETSNDNVEDNIISDNNSESILPKRTSILHASQESIISNDNVEVKVTPDDIHDSILPAESPVFNASDESLTSSHIVKNEVTSDDDQESVLPTEYSVLNNCNESATAEDNVEIDVMPDEDLDSILPTEFSDFDTSNESMISSNDDHIEVISDNDTDSIPPTESSVLNTSNESMMSSCDVEIEATSDNDPDSILTGESSVLNTNNESITSTNNVQIEVTSDNDLDSIPPAESSETSSDNVEVKIASDNEPGTILPAEQSVLDICNESVTLSDNVEIEVTSDSDVDSILPAAPSVPDTSCEPESHLPSVNDNEMIHPELVDSIVPSETDDKSDITLSSELRSFDLYKNNGSYSDRTHTIPNGNTLAISESSSDEDTQTISAGIEQTISSAGDMKSNTIPVSLTIRVSPDQSKKDTYGSVGKCPDVRDRTVDCIRGKRILEKLGVNNKVQKMGNNHMQSLSTESILMNDSILFVAEKIPNPIYNLRDFNVPEVLSQLIENLNIQPKPIQAYSWGPAIRGKNVVGISPSGSGKSLAYIVPILASLCQYNIYSDIKFSNGPFVLILVPSWEKAISVYEQCKRISQINKEIVVEVTYGGGEESKKTVNLLNGCHILVATLPCFQRMLESQFTNLDRLCHLVIDDADILLQDFYKEIIDLMCKYKSLVEYRDKCYQRHQVLAFSSKWTSYIDGFVKNAIHDPVLVITDMMEASVYGGVKQIPIMCEESERKDQLVKLVPQIIKKGEKIIIFAPDEECFELQIILEQILQKPVAVACNAQYKSEWEIIATEWNLPLSKKESCRVLVSSDLALCDLYINDATCIVHYQMPKRKIHIGLRIQAMSNYYHHYNNNKNPDKIVKSYILITPEDKKQVKSLKSFLMRSADVTDKETWDFLSNLRQVEDSDPEKELCINIKAFGKCRNKHHCENRHCMVPFADLNGACSQHIRLPLQGDVRVKILHVKAANNFYVRILEHQIGSQKSIQVHSDLASLIMGMALYYSNNSNRKVLDELKSGMLCVVNTSEQFSRVKVLQPYDNASKNTASLFFVDIGKVESHPICNLYQLAEEFKTIPFQAVEVFLCRLYPVDLDTKWTPAANSFAEGWLGTKMLYGKIRFVMDNTLWLDPLLERTFLKAIKSVTNGPSLRRELINNNLAIDNPQHLIQLHNLFEGYVPKMIPSNKLDTSCPTWEFELESETLQPGDDYENVTISYIFNPGHFYVQKLDMKICLHDLMIKIQEKMNLETEPQQKREWVTGMHCLSKSSLDNRWYRVIILTLLDSKAVVHFIDYGNIEEVCIDELQTMPRELMYLPSQAIECKLAHIKSAEDLWSAKCNDFMYYLTMTADNVYKTLAVNVDHEVSTEGKLPQYYVNLLDTSYQRVKNIAQELVWWKMATAIDDFFQPLFSKPVTLKMFYPSASKIKDMCAVLYHDQTSSEQYSQLIMSYLRVCLNHPEKLIEENVPDCFLKLLAYTHELDMFSLTVEYIKLLMSTPSTFDNLLSSGILQSLGQVLKMHDDVNILHMTLQLIQYMTEINTSLVKTIASLKSGLFSILCEIVKSIYPNEIRTAVCRLLELFCLADQRCTENLIEFQICPLYLPNVLEVEDHDFTEAYLSLLDPVSLLDSGLVAVKREKPIQEIMEIVEKGSCEKCVYKCLVVLKRLAEKSRKNKTQLLELNAVAILSSCQNLLNGTEAATLCQELLDGLLVKVNYNQNSNPAICTQLQPTNESNFHVLWCQNKFRLLITLKINHSVLSDCQFQKTSVHFSFVLPDGVQQSVYYELFDEVVVKKCSFCVQNNDVILSLCKAEVKYWPRLLQDKYNKPPNLFVDFEKIEDSDDSGSDEFEADEENPFTLEVVLKKPLIQIVKKKSSNEEEEEAVPLPVDTANSDEDSLENSDFEDYDRFNIFNAKYS